MDTKVTRFSAGAIFLHWLMALGLISAWVMGIYMVNMAGFSPLKLKLFNWHKWLGVCLLTLALIRLLWRLTHPAPALPASMPRWEQLAAKSSHHLLYLLMFLLPLSGYLYSLAAGYPIVLFGWLPLPVLFGKAPEWSPILEQTHQLLAYALAALVVMHGAAALKHHWFDKDQVLRQMLPRWHGESK